MNIVTWQFLLAGAGAVLIRLLHFARRRLAKGRYFSFADFLDEEKHIHTGGFLLIALPPLVGGLAIGLAPGAHPATATAAGFLAAFLGVWPVLQHPYALLDEYMQPHWPKLRFLYLLFIGSSAALGYLGFLLARLAVPLGAALVGTEAWQNFRDDLAANALYDVFKLLLVTLISLAGAYAVDQRRKIGEAASAQEERESLSPPSWGDDPYGERREYLDAGDEERP